MIAEDVELSLGHKRVRWLATPHLPHNWECGHLFEASTRTLFCGDLFTQAGSDLPALTERDLVGPSEQLRRAMHAGSVAIEADSRSLPEKLAVTAPLALATMHGSSYRGDGAAMLRALGQALGA